MGQFVWASYRVLSAGVSASPNGGGANQIRNIEWSFMITVARSTLPLRLVYNLAMSLVDPCSKRLSSIPEPFAVCIYDPCTVVIIPVDRGCWYRLQHSWYYLPQAFKWVRTVLPGIPLGCASEPLNEIQLAVELRVKDDKVVGSFHLLL